MKNFLNNYKSNILDIFTQKLEKDKANMKDPWVAEWAYQQGEIPDDISEQEKRFYRFNEYNGPQDLSDWFEWSKGPRPDYFQKELIDPLIARSANFDRKVILNHNIQFNFDKFEQLAKNNSQDFILQNAYPMPEPARGKRILDFGAGYGRQACLWNLMSDEDLVYVGVDAIPKSYCLQHFYYSNFDKPFYDYVVDSENFKLNQNSRGNYHLPTWRLDLLPDNYFDKVFAVQVLPELSEKLVVYALQQFHRILKPLGMIYLRDHKNTWNPVHSLNVDAHLANNGFAKEFEPNVEDKVDIYGMPRIFRKNKN